MLRVALEPRRRGVGAPKPQKPRSPEAPKPRLGPPGCSTSRPLPWKPWKPSPFPRFEPLDESEVGTQFISPLLWAIESGSWEVNFAAPAN